MQILAFLSFWVVSCFPPTGNTSETGKWIFKSSNDDITIYKISVVAMAKKIIVKGATNLARKRYVGGLVSSKIEAISRHKKTGD